MKQLTGVNSPDSMDSLDLILTKNSQASLSSEETDTRVRYDYNTSETFYEIDVHDLNLTWYPDELFRDLIENLSTFVSNSDDHSIIDDLHEVIAEEARVVHPTESNDMGDRIQTTDENLSLINSSAQDLGLIRPSVEKIPINSGRVRPIAFFNSVTDTESASHKQLKILYPLEETYRARYKSDYFPQTGASRRPRYVADKDGNHYITLQMPTEYNRELEHAFLRVALITTAIDGREHYYSPYKFQTDHYDSKIPDENPIYLPVESSFSSNNSIMKLQLVLIKSKLDKLAEAQPLKIFSDTISDMKNIISEEKLSPKDLINTYQLDKSHIAFTLCTKSYGGIYEAHPETTVISSIITEATTKKSPIQTNETNVAMQESSTEICCPNCSHRFNLYNSVLQPNIKKRESSNSTPRTPKKRATNSAANKKRKANK